MRELILDAAKECTVLLSSHILSEVTNVCTRAIVIEAGEKRYDGPMSALLQGENALRVVFSGSDLVAESLRNLPGVTLVRPVPGKENTVDVCHEAGRDFRLDVSQCITGCGAFILEMIPMQGGLENAFLRLLDEKEVQP